MKLTVMISLATILAAQIPTVPLLALPAVAACNTDQDVFTNCWQGFRDAAREIVRTERDEGRKRVQTVGEALKDCQECATQNIREGIDSFSTGFESNSSTRSSSNGN